MTGDTEKETLIRFQIPDEDIRMIEIIEDQPESPDGFLDFLAQAGLTPEELADSFVRLLDDEERNTVLEGTEKLLREVADSDSSRRALMYLREWSAMPDAAKCGAIQDIFSILIKEVVPSRRAVPA